MWQTPAPVPVNPAVVSQPPSVEAFHPVAPMRPRRTWYIVLILCFFAAVIPETLATTSTSVAKILGKPTDLLFVILFYGPADLLIRELVIRRRLGWVSIVLLGVAFGFINEGVVAGTWYTVKPTGYLFLGAIDFAWVAALTVFHLFVSVIMPIAFIETAFPSLAGRPLLRRRRGIVISAVIFLLITSLFLFVPSFRPYRVVVFALALILALVAFRLPASRPRIPLARPAPGLWRLRWAGFFAMFGYFALIYLLPAMTLKLMEAHIASAQLAYIAVFALFAALLLWTGRRWTGRAGWSPRHTLALITGALAFPILLTLLPFFWPTLEYVATLPFLVLLIALNLRLRRRERRLRAALSSAPPDEWRHRP
ncbi:MAG TPA: hypothetical protein VFQ32_02380 [Ktedonobacterales bacterium]|nr:hypothetical protein [Ktedonobacterales bacterium]